MSQTFEIVEALPCPAASEPLPSPSLPKALTFLHLTNPATGEQYLRPEYAGFFSRLHQLLMTLKERQKQGWSESERRSFLEFVDECSLYLEEWIFAGLVKTWEDF